jgi:CheY-like chemotaxis protein
MVLKEMLKKLGCTFHLCSDGAEAVEQALAGRFDVVLMDQNMPVMDGLEATRRIREANAGVKIVGLTASNLQANEDDCMRAGMNAFLCKPVTLASLAAVLQKLS